MAECIYQDAGLIIFGVPCDDNGVIDEVTRAKLLEIITYMVTCNLKEVVYGNYTNGCSNGA